MPLSESHQEAWHEGRDARQRIEQQEAERLKSLDELIETLQDTMQEIITRYPGDAINAGVGQLVTLAEVLLESQGEDPSPPIVLSIPNFRPVVLLPKGTTEEQINRFLDK